jgi:hypothetical protein
MIALHRTIVTFADDWADPEPNGACYHAAVDTICVWATHLHSDQRPAAHAWRYFGEVNNGGHAQYFMNLEAMSAQPEHVPEAIEGLRCIGLSDVADILAQAHLRWTGAARLAPADLVEAAEIFAEREFDDLDNAFYAFNLPPQKADRPEDRLDRYMLENRTLFVDLQSATVSDQKLIAMGNPTSHEDGGRAAWLSLVEHPSPRVRLKAARILLGSDRDVALKLVREIHASKGSMPFMVWWQADRLMDDAGKTD